MPHSLAVALPLLWLARLALTEWVPMFPLNDLRPGNLRTRLLATAINYPFPPAISASPPPPGASCTAATTPAP
ncbi:hypothetical protein [Kitasatospora sp. NPDC088134]|uniref:hypothetical protein n=1 Tax=Kitasatospora sp. NPDC088134 TaxID=3364071 RepID=UPI0037F1FFAD